VSFQAPFLTKEALIFSPPKWIIYNFVPLFGPPLDAQRDQKISGFYGRHFSICAATRILMPESEANGLYKAGSTSGVNEFCH
jgi:hypothetical protein